MSFSIHIDGKYVGSSASTDVKHLTGASLREPAQARKGEIVSLRTGGRVCLYRVLPGLKGASRDLHLGRADGLGEWYLAGPMRGYAHHNFPAFLTAAAHLKSLGFEIIDPATHDMEAGFDMTQTIEEQGFDIQKALGWDFTQIVGCDGIILLDGWEKSAGAKAERLVAEMTGKLILRLNANLTLFAESGWNSDLVWIQTGQA